MLVMIIGSLFLFNYSFAQTADEDSIRNVLYSQEKAWNTGNIEDFMKAYWQSDSLTYIGKAGVTYGWQKTLETYKKNYPDTVAMGRLTYNLIELKSLSPGYYFVIGQWHLQRTSNNAGGYFTLLFKKIKNKWFIVADHSS